MKRDLTEFKDTVQTDTLSAVSSTTTYLKTRVTSIGKTITQELDSMSPEEKPDETTDDPAKDNSAIVNPQEKGNFAYKTKESFSSMFSSIVDVLMPTTFDDDDEELCLLNGKVIVPLERWNTLVKSIQTDPHTFCHEPDGPPENYESWLETFSLIDHEGEVEKLLGTVTEIKSIYVKLVPESMTHCEFWHRYFYRIHLLRELEIKRAQIKQAEEDDSPENSEKLNVLYLREDQPKKLDLKMDEFEDKSLKASPTLSDAKKSSGSSDDWEKADLGDIVDEAARKLNEKLNTMPDNIMPKPEDEIGEWVDWE